MGDIIYSLPTILAIDAKAVLYLRDRNHLDNLYRLLKLQPYIQDIKSRDDLRSSFIDLSGKFYQIAWTKRNQHLAISHLEAQNKTYDLTLPWLHSIKPDHVADIIINRTSKYHDRIGQIEWELLKPFEDKCKFIGLSEEMKRFQRQKINISHHETKDALEMAQVIKGSKLFIGNQSLAFAIAEGMKHPRCLEFCDKFNNCQPNGPNGYTNLTVELIKRHLN